MMTKKLGALLIAACIAAAFGCERKPEDLEVWRTSEGGYEKMSEWARSAEEPAAVRVRAVQILIEEHQPNEVGVILEELGDEALRKQMVDAARPTVQAMWDKKDWPVIEDGASGLVKVEGRSESVGAKDAAYFLQPHADGESKAAYEAILAQWMSQDQDVRDQLGNTTLAQIAPRAGAQAVPMMLKWLEVTKSPSVVVDKITQATADDPNEEITAALATAIAKRCEAEHPELSPQTEVAMLKVQHKNLVPYLERAIMDDKSPTKLLDAVMDSYTRIMKDRAAPLFSKLVAEKSGLLRWVSATRLIEIRGKAGALAAAQALPLEADTYSEPEDDSFEKESEIFCNFVNSELKSQDVDAVPLVKQFLGSNRWPVRVLGVRCAKTTDAKALKDDLLAMKKDKTYLPGWGDKTTLGELAVKTAGEL